jgi:hypothetical protein
MQYLYLLLPSSAVELESTRMIKTVTIDLLMAQMVDN